MRSNMNQTFIFIVICLAIFVFFLSVGILIFGITVIVQHASGFTYEDCLELYFNNDLCDMLIPPLPLQIVNWTVPFP